MSQYEAVRSALLKETTDGTYKKLSSVKVSELVEPMVVMERRDWPGSEWGVYRVTGTMKGDWGKAVEMVKSIVADSEMTKMMGDVTMKVLEEESDGDVVYTVHKTPWPMSNRESIVHRSLAFTDDRTFVYAMHSVPGAKQVNKDNVFTEVFIDGLILQKLDEDKIAIWSIGGMDLGNIPEMLVNAFISDSALVLGKFQRRLIA